MLAGLLVWLSKIIGWNKAAVADPMASLWDRLGGEIVTKPVGSAINDRHASDPLSADLFGPRKSDTSWITDGVNITFFSSRAGGPHKYEGLPIYKKVGIDEPTF